MNARLSISKDLSLPREVVTSTDVVYGGKGMGKTNLGGVIVEELTKSKLRWSVLDPMGVWWGLRHSSDGKGPGIECIILGGAHGDIPIEPTGGAVVADLVIDEGVDTIIDFSRKANGQMWSVGEKIRFVTEYTYRLFQRQGELVNGHRREPIKQILDEAARYIPQVIPSGAIDLAKCVAAWEQVCEEGRNIGLGVTFLTQRSARMNKSVSELADVMFAFRTIGPNSLAAVMDWLGEHVEKKRVHDLASQVRELDVGQALVVSPGWLKVEKIISVRIRETFDSSATPRPGERAKRVTGKAAKPDLAKYESRMSETIERVKQENPAALRKEIVRLQGELSRKEPPRNVIATKIERIEVPAIGKKTMERFKKAETSMRRILGAIKEANVRTGTEIAIVEKHVNQFSAELRKVELSASHASASAGVSPARPAAQTPPPQPRHKVAPLFDIERALPAGAEITEPEQRVLDGIAWMENIGVAVPKKEIVAFLARYAHIRSKGFTNPCGSLRAKGLIEYTNAGGIKLTDVGRALAQFPSGVGTTNDLHRIVLERLDDPKRRVLKPLLERGKVMTNADLCQAAGYMHERSKGYTNPRGALRSYGLIEYVDGGVQATDVLFLNI